MMGPSPATQGQPMSAISVAARRPNHAAVAAFVVAAGGAATILGAYYFQYVIGLQPCELCFKERIPYYVAIPLALVVAVAAVRGAPRSVVRIGLAVIAIAMLILVGMSVYHAGVEWKFWPGPTECTGPVNAFGNAGTLMDQMNKTSIVRCDEAAWRLFGISLAGYNALISLALAAVAAWGIFSDRANA
jgi:disulfide bond formation protein DsbB